MNTSVNDTSMAAARLSPIVQILCLSRALLARFPEVRCSASWLVQWAREHICWQRKVSADVAAIDDPIERNMDFFEELFANDPPAKRARARAIFAQVHRGTETTSTELAPVVPEYLDR
jgi:hypothetical protein